jgi:hypothetical protein
MDIKDNGGAAFPVSDVVAIEPRTTAEMISMIHGMSLRDYFAAKAMQSFASMSDTFTGNPYQINPMCADAYKWADAMLLERSK